MTDPIQHLRSRQSAAQIERPWRYDETSQCIFDADDTPVCDAISRVEGRYIVALVNAAPALLAVVEAAREMRKVQRQRAYDASACAAGRNYSEETQVSLEQDCDCALAKLDEVKPNAQADGSPSDPVGRDVGSTK